MASEDDALRPATSLADAPYASVPILIPEVPELDDEANDEDEDGIESDFDPRYREPFTGLLFLGKLNKTESILGHTFKFRTPSLRERLAAGLLHKKYMNTVSAGQAWSAITVSLYLEEVDGDILPEPIGPDPQTAVESRFNWVVDNINDKVLDRLFEKTLDLDQQVETTLLELEKIAKT